MATDYNARLLASDIGEGGDGGGVIPSSQGTVLRFAERIKEPSPDPFALFGYLP